MKFLERHHYCPSCKDRKFFFTFTTKSFIQNEQKCPNCSHALISYWQNLPLKYILVMVLALSMSAAAIFFSFWPNFNRSGYNLLINIIATAQIILMGILLIVQKILKPKSIPPDESFNSLEELKSFRFQSLYIILLILILIPFIYLIDYFLLLFLTLF